MKILKLLEKQLHNKDYLLLHLKSFRFYKGSEVIISIHGTTNRVLSSSSSYIVDVVMWPYFG